jgi:hypothetical protein
MGIFELDENHTIVTECFMNSNIYYIDNFYKNPDEIIDFLEHHDAPLHRPGQHPHYKSLNGIHFFDMRHEIIVDEIENVSSYLSSICGQSAINQKNLLMTNKSKFLPCRFNDYKNKYWHPHIDHGYTAIIYLNVDDEECGTNLYTNVIIDDKNSFGEHVTPWRSNYNWSVIKHLKPKFNRCVIFDGLKFYHGMNICNDKYFGDQYRLNQVLFFE